MLVLAALALVVEASACDVSDAEVRRQQALSYEQFDEGNGQYSWRQLNAKGCADAAVNLLKAYASNAHALTMAQRSENAFHQGQVLAFAGRDAESIEHFAKARAMAAGGEWTTYVDATLAFLRKDFAALNAARERYARLAGDSMRLQVIDGFIAFPAEPYAKAAHCKM
jgi:hypothetical protein